MEASWRPSGIKLNADVDRAAASFLDQLGTYVKKRGLEATLPQSEDWSAPAPSLAFSLSRPPLETGLSLRWEAPRVQGDADLGLVRAATPPAGKAGAGLYFPIRLDLVALHEFGHALGLVHYPDTAANSIMEAYYNSSYDIAGFTRQDVAIFANGSDGYINLLELYTLAGVQGNTTPWRQSVDGTTGNSRIDLTYSFVPDGTRLEGSKTSSLYAVFNSLFGANNWQRIFSDQLTKWADASGGLIVFTSRNDSGTATGSGAVQNDSRFGDIRIGSHKFDGAGGTLAHTYYPPNSNNSSIAGDAHFASEESWVGASGATVLSSGTMVSSSTQIQITSSGQIVYHCLLDHFG